MLKFRKIFHEIEKKKKINKIKEFFSFFFLIKLRKLLRELNN